MTAPLFNMTERRQDPTASLLPLLVAVMLLGAAMYLHGIRQNLPYHLNSDEPAIWLRVNHLKTTGSLQDTYSPARIVLLALEFRVLDAISSGGAALPAQYLWGRVTTILYWLIGVAAGYQAGKTIHSRRAGIAAALYLISHPLLFASPRNSRWTALRGLVRW